MERSLPEGCTVLVVEDEPLIAMDVELAFHECTCRVVIANTVKDALALIEQEQFAVGILDHGLTDGESTGVYERLRNRGVPFIIYSGHEVPEDQRNGGVVVSKPVAGDQLRDVVETLLRVSSDHHNS